jgi:hypothetical protein
MTMMRFPQPLGLGIAWSMAMSTTPGAAVVFAWFAAQSRARHQHSLASAAMRWAQAIDGGTLGDQNAV